MLPVEYSYISSYPAAYEGCISVASIAADYTPSSFSNYGAEVDFCAPGGDSEYHCVLEKILMVMM